MVLTKAEAEINLRTSKSNLRSKKRQIVSAKKRSDFKGVRIKDQFDVGILGIESFREQGISRRRLGLKDLAGFQSEIPGLKQDVLLKKQELDFFSLGEL